VRVRRELIDCFAKRRDGRGGWEKSREGGVREGGVGRFRSGTSAARWTSDGSKRDAIDMNIPRAARRSRTAADEKKRVSLPLARAGRLYTTTVRRFALNEFEIRAAHLVGG
jgi:hypothetical protein